MGYGFRGNPWTKTGPMVDHTFFSSQGLFAYTDSTMGTTGSKTLMVTPSMSCIGSQCCMEFYYHMYGQGMGTLNIYIRQPIFGDILVDTIGGESLGSQWRRYRTTISPINPQDGVFQIVFEGIRSYAPAIIAIDDVAVFQESCPKEPTVRTLPYTCNFTMDMCGMYSSRKDGNVSFS